MSTYTSIHGVKLRDTTRGGSAGFSLVEVMIALTLFLLMLGGFAMTSMRAGDHFSAGEERSVLDQKGARVMDRMLAEIVEARRSGLVPNPAPPFGSSDVTYQKIVGYAGGAAQWGPTRRIELELDPGEVDDGQDNDGDGLIDEGQVVFVENPDQADERRLVWVRGVSEMAEGEIANGVDDNGNGLVDEAGFSLDLQGEVLTLRLTIEAVGLEGERLTRTVENAVRLRN